MAHYVCARSNDLWVQFATLEAGFRKIAVIA
jgi:hypothetical protein